jgi:hypothetical protein
MNEIGVITYRVVSGDKFSDSLVFENEDGTDYLLTGYSGCVMEIRKGRDETTALWKRLTLALGLTITTNVLAFDFGQIDLPAGKYYSDIRFLDGTDPTTPIQVDITVVNNRSEL